MANTTAPLSETAIANMAVDILDDYRLNDLDDDTTVGRWMARNFGIVRDEVLQSYTWHKVRTRASLPADAQAPPFGWDYSYTVPEDCLRLLELRENGELNGRLIPYEYENGKILTDAKAPLRVRYIRREDNVALFQPLMARVLSARLAYLASLTITGKQQYSAKAEKLLNEAWEMAKLVDTLESGTPEHQYDDDIIEIRGVGL